MILTHTESLSGASGSYTFTPKRSCQVVSIHLIQSSPLSTAHTLSISYDGGATSTQLVSATAIPGPLHCWLPANARQPLTILWSGTLMAALHLGLRHGR